ncbi:hypothetical protein MANES_04G052789v8 [Manihot esculenta]|uniref:Uncharacterized protein n=1 Tax=Manihot esculenta TaxID=3983 RepID=A0ACB7HUB7_MANES|nr:hypothetical protein MANES_04G052789v8 [Manihot esculenta]
MSPKTSTSGGIKIEEPSTNKDKGKITILTEYNETSSSSDNETIYNPLDISDSDQEINVPINTIERQNNRPDDLKILDRKQKQYNAKNIYEWNIDDLSETEIIQITKEKWSL